MEYNKNQFSKVSDKKVLHKKGKKWITLSLGLLMAIGGTAAVSHADTTTNADTTTPNGNQQKQSSNRQTPKYNLQATTPQAQQGTENGRKLAPNTPNLKAIGKQANTLYQHILLNNMHNSQANAPQTKPSATANSNRTDQSASNNAKAVKPSVGDNQSASNSASNAKVNSNVPNNAPIHQTAKPNSAYANYLKMMGGSSAYDQMMNNEAKQQNQTNSTATKSNKPKLLNEDNGSSTFSKTNWIYTSDGNGHVSYLSDGQVHDWENSTSDYDGLSYKYDSQTGALEFTGGTMRWNNHTPAGYANPFIGYSNSIPNMNLSDIKSIKLDSDINFSNIHSLSTMFDEAGGLKSISLPHNVSEDATNTYMMFYSDPSLMNVEFSKGFGENITNAESMFRSDSALTNLTLGDGFGQNISNAGYMFFDDSALTNLTLGDGFGKKISNAKDMFDKDSSLTKLILPNGFGQKISDAIFMFDGDSSLTKLILPDGFGQNLTQSPYMFEKDSSLTKLILPDGFGQDITNAQDMFTGDSSLTKLILPNGFGQNISNGWFMFGHDPSLTNVTLPEGFGQNLTRSPDMFADDPSLTKLILPDGFGRKIGNAGFMFAGDSSLTNLTLPDGFGQNITSADGMFSSNKNLSSLTLPNNFGQNLTSKPGNMFPHKFYDLKDEGNGTTITNFNDVLDSDTLLRDARNGINVGGTYVNYYTGTYDGLNFKIYNGTGDLEFTNGTLNWDGTSNTTFLNDAPAPLKNAAKITFDSDVDFSNTHNLSNMFFNDSDLHSVTFKNTHNAISDMTNMFGNDQVLSDVDLSTLNTNDTHSMANLFMNDHNLTQITFGPNFNTSKVSDMAGMFMNDKSLPRIDLSHFDTSNVNTMLDIFSGDSNLTDLDVSNFNTSKVRDMAGMFFGLSKLANLDVSHFDTRYVTDMSSMFAGDPVSAINGLGNFNTSDVTDMNSMFFNMGNITDLDLSSFNTNNVTDMRDMFGLDTALTGLTLGTNFSTEHSNKNETYMFESDKQLGRINSKSRNFKIANDAMYNHKGVNSTNVANLRDSQHRPLMSMVREHRPLLGLWSFNPSTDDYDEIVYYDGNREVGQSIFHGATGQSDNAAMGELSLGVLPGLDTSKYYVADQDELANLESERLDYDNKPQKVLVAPVKQGSDEIEYVLSDGTVVGQYTEKGARDSGDDHITQDLQKINSGKTVNMPNGYGITPQGVADAQKDATVKYNYLSGVAKINVKKVSSDVIDYVDGSDDQVITSYSFHGVNPWSDSSVHQALYGFLNGTGGYKFPSDYYLTSQGNQDVSNALNTSYHYDNPKIEIHLARKHADVINIVNSDNQTVKSFPFYGIPNHSDSRVVQKLNNIQNDNNIDDVIYSDDPYYIDGQEAGYVLTPQGRNTIQNAIKGQYNYDNSTVTIGVQAKLPDYLTFEDVSDNNHPYVNDYYGQKGTVDSNLRQDLQDASNGIINYNFDQYTDPDEFYIASDDQQTANDDARKSYKYGTANLVIPIHENSRNYIRFVDQNDGSDIGTNTLLGRKGASDKDILTDLNDIENYDNPGFNFDESRYKLSSDSVQDAENALASRYHFDNQGSVTIRIKPIQYANDAIEYYYGGKLIGKVSANGATGDDDTNSAITNSDVVKNIGNSGVSYSYDNDGTEVSITHPGIDTTTYYVSQDALNALNSYVQSHQHQFKFNNTIYRLNLSKYPSGINAVDLVTSDNHVVKQFTLSDVTRHTFDWNNFIKQYPSMNPMVNNPDTGSSYRTIQNLTNFDPTGTGNYQLSPEGQYEYSLLYNNQLSPLNYKGDVLKINIQPKHVASFTAVYTINGRPFVTTRSTGLYGYRVDGQNYLSYRVFRKINGHNVYLNSTVLQPLLDASSSLEMDPNYHGIDNTKFLYDNQVVTIPLVYKMSVDSFKYMDGSNPTPVYTATIVGKTDSITSDAARTQNSDGTYMPKGLPNLNNSASANDNEAGFPDGIPDALVNYRFAPGFKGINNAEFNGSTTFISVKPAYGHVDIKPEYTTQYYDEHDGHYINVNNKTYPDMYKAISDVYHKKGNKLTPDDPNDTTIQANLNNLGNMPAYYEVDTTNLVQNMVNIPSANNYYLAIDIKPRIANDWIKFNGDQKADYWIKGSSNLAGNQDPNGESKQGDSVIVNPPKGYSFVTTKPSDTTDGSVSNNQGAVILDGGTHVFTVVKDHLISLPAQSGTATEIINYNWVSSMGNGKTSTSTSTSSIVATYARSDNYDTTTESSFVGNWSQTNLANFSMESAPTSLGWHYASSNYSGYMTSSHPSIDPDEFSSAGIDSYASSAVDNIYMNKDSNESSLTVSNARVTVNYLDKSGFNPSVASPYSSAIAYSREKYTDNSNASNSSFGDWSTNSSVALPKSAAPKGMHVVSVSVTNTLPSPGSAVDNITGDEYVENVYYSDIINHGTDYASAVDTTNYYINGTKSALSSATQDSIEYSRANEYNERLNSYINYGSWSTSSAFNKISYPSELVSNGRYYYESSADVSLPSVAQNSLTSKQASYSNNVYYTLHSAQIHVYFENAKGQNLLPSGSYSNVAVTPYSNVSLSDLVSSGYQTKISGYHFVKALHSLSQYSDRDNEAHIIDLLYAPNTSTEDYAPAVDTINYLSSGTNGTAVSSASHNVVEYSRADVDSAMAPSYGSWYGSDDFSSISFPSEISANGSYYHRVSANSTLPTNNSVNASLDNSSANHEAEFTNNAYYALDSYTNSTQSTTVSEAVDYVFSSKGGSSVSSMNVGPVTYTRSYVYDPYDKDRTVSVGSWQAGKVTMPASASNSYWSAVSSNMSSPSSANLQPNSRSNYAYTVDMAGVRVNLHIIYRDPTQGYREISSDNISGQYHVGDTVKMPTKANANSQYNLANGYQLDNDQISNYLIQNYDTVNNGVATKNVSLLAVGKMVSTTEPITIRNLTSDDEGHQWTSDHTIQWPINEAVGTTVGFDISSFKGDVPVGFHFDSDYNGTDYNKLMYKIHVTPSDVNGWNSDSWEDGSNNPLKNDGNYWDDTNNRPLIVLKADSNKSITVHFINQNHQEVGQQYTEQGGYGSRLDTSSSDALNGEGIQIPNGYRYGNNNQSSITFGLQPRSIDINVIGNSVNVPFEYVYREPNGQKDTIYSGTTTGNVGDHIIIPEGSDASDNNLRSDYTVIDNPDPNQDSDTHISDTAVRQYTVQPSNNTVMIPVKTCARVVPVQFYDQQTGQPVGDVNDSVTGLLGQTANLPSAPQGYKYVSSQTYQFTQDNVKDDSHMKPVSVQLSGDNENVPVRYVDQNGNLIGSGTIMGQQIGDQISDVSKQVNVPANYSIDSDQSTSYTLTPSDIDTNNTGSMKPLNILVHATAPTYQFIIQQNEYTHSHSRLIKTVTIPETFSAKVGDTFTYNPDDNVPNGFSDYVGNDKPANQPITIKVTNQGLINTSNNNLSDSITWNYQGESIPDAISFDYVDASDNDKVVGGPYKVNGHVGSRNDLPKHDAVPAGYYLDNSDSTNYTVTPNTQTIHLRVRAKNSSQRDFNLHVVVEDPYGNQLPGTTSYSIPVKVKENGSTQTVDASKYYPDGDSKDYTLIGNNKITFANNPKGLSPTNGTFTYQAKSSASDSNIKPITVQYKNQTGTIVNSKKISNGYEGQTIDVTKPSDGGLSLPAGYTQIGGQKVNYTFGNQSQNAIIHIQGKQVNDIAYAHVDHLTSDKYGNLISQGDVGISDTIQVPITGQVGGTASIPDSFFNNYLPAGYHFAPGFVNHVYNAYLTPSDANSDANQDEHLGKLRSSDSWQNSKLGSQAVSGGYWYKPSTNKPGMPEIELEADPHEEMYAGIFDEKTNQLLTYLPPIYGHYNDAVYVNDYKAKMMHSLPGYYYDPTNNKNPQNGVVRFGRGVTSVGIFVKGKPENVDVKYQDQSDKETWSDATLNNGYQVGDTVTLPENKVPTGYHITGNPSLQYTISLSDDPDYKKEIVNSDATSDQVSDVQDKLSQPGTITKYLSIAPNTETLPVKFMDEDGNLVGNVNYKTKGTIGDKNVGLPSAPDGYTINTKDSRNPKGNKYDFIPDKIDTSKANGSFMKKQIIYVTGDPATVRINYMDLKNRIYSDSDKTAVGQKVSLPTNINQVDNGKWTNDYELENSIPSVTVQPSDAYKTVSINLNVVGKIHNATNLTINVDYEDNQGHVTATANGVPVTVTGRYDNQAYYDPSNLAVPAGYQIDTNKTQSDYKATMDQNDDDAKWSNGKQPTIYLRGNAENNDQVEINQVVESPAGTIMKVVQTPVTENGDVGDPYTIAPTDVKQPSDGHGNAYQLANGSQPNASLNKSVTGYILDNGTTTYLSNPTDTLYYVDPNAKSSITLHYINQDGNDVKDQSGFTQADGSTLAPDDVKNNVPNGYTLKSSNSDQGIKFGTSNQDVNINVVGNPETIHVEYDYNGSKIADDKSGSTNGDQIVGKVKVGDKVQLPTSSDQIPSDYMIADGQPTDYVVNYRDNNNGQILRKLNLSSLSKTLKFNYVDQAKHTVANSAVAGRFGDVTKIQLPDSINNYYHLNTNRNVDNNNGTNSAPDKYTFESSQLNHQDQDYMNSDEVHVIGDKEIVPVEFVDQNSHEVSHTEMTGQMGSTITLPSAPKNYQYVNGESNQYTLMLNNAQTPETMKAVVVKVQGRHVNPSAHNGNQVAIHLFYEDAQGHQINSDVQYEDVDENVGSDYEISPETYRPSDYDLDTNDNRDQPVVGTVKADGTVSVPSVNFYYKVSSKASTAVQPITVNYVDNGQLIKSATTNDHGKYVGYVISDVTRDSTDGIGMPSDHNDPSDSYQLADPNQNVRVIFGTTPWTITLNIKPSKLFSDTFIVNANEKDANGQIVNTVRTPIDKSGLSDGNQLQFKPSDYVPKGFVMEPSDRTVNTIVGKSDLMPDHITWTYDAINHGQANAIDKPIIVKYFDTDTGQTLKEANVYGNWGAYVDVTNPDDGGVKVPTGYALNSNQKTTYQITSNEQHVTVGVHGESAGEIAVVDYVDEKTGHMVAQRAINAPIGTRMSDKFTQNYINYVPYDYDYAGKISWSDKTTVGNNQAYTVYVNRQSDRAQPLPPSEQSDGTINVDYQDQNGNPLSTNTLVRANGTDFNPNSYIESVDTGGKMPNDFSLVNVIGKAPTKFIGDQTQTLTIEVHLNSHTNVNAQIKYEDAKTHQMITNGTGSLLTIPLSGQPGKVINYSQYQQFIPQGYTYYGMGDHDNVLEDGDVDVIMVRKAKPVDQLHTITVNYNESDGKGHDHQVNSIKLTNFANQQFDQGYYENDLPVGQQFVSADNNVTNFNRDQTVNIKVQNPAAPARQYSSIVIHFVRADASVISPNVNGNEDTPSDQLESAELSSSIPEVMTGHVGDVFSPAEYEHNTPVNTTFDHIVKGNDIGGFTSNDQNVWIAVQTTNGQF